MKKNDKDDEGMESEKDELSQTTECTAVLAFIKFHL
jgi:hypothetical protein